MAFESLSEKLNAAFKKLRGKGRLTQADIKEAMREVRMALLEADVSYKVVKDFTKTVTERASGAEVLEALSPAQMVIKIVNEELCRLMGSENQKLNFGSKSPAVVMLVGLQGAGKTTNVAKLAGLLRRQGKRPLLAACDVYRPAAITQLQVVGAQLGLPVFEMGQIDPVTIAVEAVKYAKDHGNDIVFLDTAGRLHIDEQLMDELKRVKAAVKPNEILLVVDAMTGQDAVNAATAFDEALGIDGVVLTKLDVLTGLKEIPLCVAYDVNGERRDDMPTDQAEFAAAKPIYESMPGWDEDISQVHDFNDLPKTCQDYVKRLEELSGCRISVIGTGPQRDHIIQINSLID